MKDWTGRSRIQRLPAIGSDNMCYGVDKVAAMADFQAVKRDVGTVS